MTFLLDWELTMKCNLDCSYCDVGVGHDNSLPHPPLDECLKTLDFLFEYADAQMSKRIKGLKYVVLNVYGGEALHHPDIVTILEQARAKHQRYQDRWTLTITTTTNAVISGSKLEKIIPLIDEFTVSYHVESSDKQKQQFRDNVLTIHSAGRRLKCVVLVHGEPEKFQDVEHTIAWLKENNIRHLPRQLDHPKHSTEFNYQPQQVKWFKKLYQEKSHNTEFEFKPVEDDQGHYDLSDTGRACCGGRQLCADQNYRQREFFVNNKFTGWYCSVDKFFLYVRQAYGDVYVNKDCKMNYQGQVGPIGNLNRTDLLLAQVNLTPTIQCAKLRCQCGLCSPKAEDLDTYNSILKKYQI